MPPRKRKQDPEEEEEEEELVALPSDDDEEEEEYVSPLLLSSTKIAAQQFRSATPSPVAPAASTRPAVITPAHSGFQNLVDRTVSVRCGRCRPNSMVWGL